MKANITNNKKNTTMRKIVPAAGMLSISAVMLATSTYAWFTMNKEVEVKGLQMQATASSGLEISLGAFGTQSGTKAVSVNTPSKEDISWKRAILVSDYYKEIGKILPSSSDDAYDIYKVPAAKVYAGGHAVETDATITSATQADSATLTLQTYGSGTGNIATVDTAGTEGYYIDIPMWIRTSNQETTGTPVYATVTVTDPDDSNGSALIKAARVAIIPIASANAETGSCNVTYASTSYSSDSSNLATVTPLASSTTSIFGLKANGTSAAMDTNTAIDWPTYHDGKVINATGTYTPSGTGTTLGTTSLSAARGLGETSIAPTNVFTIPAATADDYGRVGFVARVWLEGESIYCEDATANQDWNIDFHFSTENTTLPNYTVTP